MRLPSNAIQFPQIEPTQLPQVPGGLFAAAPRKPSFFGEGGVGRGIAGTVGDFLLASSGMRPIYAPAMQAQRDRQQQSQDFNRRQQAEMQQWIAQEQWKRANPAPAAPHYWTTNDGSLAAIGPDGQPRVLYQDPTPKVDWITAQNPDGTKQLIPMPQGGGFTPPKAPVGKLTPMGGASPAGSRTFPVR